MNTLVPINADRNQRIKNISEFLEMWFTQDLIPPGPEKEVFNNYYSGYLHKFGSYMKFNYAQQTRELMALFGKINNPMVLEVGSGCGTESLWMALNGASVRAIDIRDDRLAVAKLRKSITENLFNKCLDCTFENKNILDVNQNSKFDIIWLEQSFHHLEPREEVLDAIAALMKIGGFLVISEANAWNPLIQAMLFHKRGTKTLVEFQTTDGKKCAYGNERIITLGSLAKSLSRRNIKEICHRYFRILPNINRVFPNIDLPVKIARLEGILPQWFPFLFTHYNYVGTLTVGN